MKYYYRSYYANKWVLITGGSSGIGLALAKHLAVCGANIVIAARREAQLSDAKNELLALRSSSSQIIETISMDITSEDQTNQKLQAFFSQHGTPDILINSAGVAHPGVFKDLDPQIFRWTMNVNYFGTVYVTKAIVPGMVERGSGHIINVSSIAGFLGVYGYTAYSASKFAVRGFSDVLKCELKPEGIQVSVVFPPDTQTPQLEYESQFKPEITKELAGNAGVMSAEEVADKILASAAKGKYIITPGTESTLIFRLSNLTGKLIYPIMDHMVLSATRKIISRKKESKK